MAPSRPLKRQKTDQDEQPPQLPKPSQVPLPPDTPKKPETPQAQAQDSPRSSWYKSWPRKAAPVTQVAHESISKATDAASEAASVISDRISERRASTRSSSLAMTLGKTTSNRSLPIDAMTTKVNATSEASPSGKNSWQPPAPKSPSKDRVTAAPEQEPTKKDTVEVNVTLHEQQNLQKAQQESKSSEDQKEDTNEPGWFDWLPKPLQKSMDKANNGSTVKNPVPLVVDRPVTSKPDANTDPAKAKVPKVTETKVTPSEPLQNTTTPTPINANKRSWLQMWSGEGAIQTEVLPEASKAPATQATTQLDLTKSVDVPKPQTPKPAPMASSIETSPPPPLPGDGSKSAGWVFWSRERKTALANPAEEQPHLGEIAISDTPSQSRPKRASISLQKDERPAESKALQAEAAQKKAPGKAESAKQIEPQQPETQQSIKGGHTRQDSKVLKSESANAAAAAKAPEVSTGTGSPAPSASTAENLLLPSLKDTLRLPDNPSLLQQLARLLYYTKEPELKHLSLVKDPPRIRNALAIGVHGYFPGPMVRTFLGQPTGTSIKFADMAAKSIRKWTNSHGYDCQVKTAALEGEGKIAERVELLWKLLLNWIEEIRKSDFVLIACHSQGVPVAIMLLSKLIQFGCISAARVGICAMAGVNMGPFVEYKSRWISGSAGELFDFSNPDSQVSTDYVAALDILLKAGVRLTLIGSIDDQLVSLESSIFSPITHPHIYRAVSIDSRVHAPNFLSHLVGFVLKLRNLGVQDHGLVRELSSPLAGSLYSGEGHSRIYEEEAVYDLAVSFALETTTLTDVPLTKRSIAPTGGNPYILPFAMRGILEEDFVKSELQTEAQQLLREFDEWKPTTKVLKDVKFRLEGVRSKL